MNHLIIFDDNTTYGVMEIQSLVIDDVEHNLPMVFELSLRTFGLSNKQYVDDECDWTLFYRRERAPESSVPGMKAATLRN